MKMGKFFLGITFALLCITKGFAQPGFADLTFNKADSLGGNGLGANNDVHIIAKQPDGKWIISGLFTAYNKHYSRLVRIYPDGRVDRSFNPVNLSTNSNVTEPYKSLAVQPDGKILVAGDFGLYKHLARLNPDGSRDVTFSTGEGPDSPLSQVLVQPDGKILIIGNFYSYNEVNATKVCRLNSDGSLDPTFSSPISPNLNHVSLSIQGRLQSDGKIILSGNFLSSDGFPSNRLCRLLSDGSFDMTYQIGTGFDGLPVGIHLTEDDKLLAAGPMASFNGNPIPGLVAILPSGQMDASFSPALESGSRLDKFFYAGHKIQLCGQRLVGGVYEPYKLFQLEADGRADVNFTEHEGIVAHCLVADGNDLLVGGYIYQVDGFRINNICKLNPTGDLVHGFNIVSGFDGPVRDMAYQSDGKMIVIGDFTRCNGVPVHKIARLSENGDLDASFSGSTFLRGNIVALAIQPDDKILISSNYTGPLSYNGFQGKMLRLNADGTLDSSFSPNVFDNQEYVEKMLVQPDGKIVVGPRLRRLLDDGSQDPTFVVNSSNNFLDGISDISLTHNGEILVGYASSYARLDASGIRIPLIYTPPIDGLVYTVREGPAPYRFIYLAGEFECRAGVGRTQNILRVDSLGHIDEDFLRLPFYSGNTDGKIVSLDFQKDCRVIIVGDFNVFQGKSAAGICRLDPDGLVDESFDAIWGFGVGVVQPVYKVLVQNESKVLVGGDFSNYKDSVLKNNLIRIDASNMIYWYLDQDGDGFYGDSLASCSSPGSSWEGPFEREKAGNFAFDCDDTNPNIYPGALEILSNGIDENCDGVDGYLSAKEYPNTNIRIFPNPSDGVWSVETDMPSSLAVYDLSGKLLLTKQSMGTEKLVLNAPPGLYVLKINSGSNTVTYKLIKE